MKLHAFHTIKTFEQIRLDLKHQYSRFQFSEDDYKGHVLNRIDKTILFLNLNLQNYHDNLSNKLIFDQMLPTNSDYDYNEVLINYFKQNKSSFIYNLSSILETFFRELHKDLLPDRNIDKKSLYEILNSVFKCLEIDKKDNWIALMILSNIRNTIHNNGIHISEDRIFVYHDLSVNFDYNSPQSVASYELLALILYDFQSLFEIICAKMNVLKL